MGYQFEICNSHTLNRLGSAAWSFGAGAQPKIVFRPMTAISSQTLIPILEGLKERFPCNHIPRTPPYAETPAGQCDQRKKACGTAGEKHQTRADKKVDY